LPAAGEGADLRVDDLCGEGELGRCGIGGIVAGLAHEGDGYVGVGGVVFGVVGPGAAGVGGNDFGGIENDGWVVGAVEAFGTFHTDADGPGGVEAVRDD